MDQYNRIVNQVIVPTQIQTTDFSQKQFGGGKMTF